MKANRLFLACVSTLALVACGGSTELTAALTTAAERPAPVVASNASGNVTVTVDGSNLEVEGTFKDLSSNTAGAHIHGPVASAEDTAPIFCNLSVQTAQSGTITAGSGEGSCAAVELTDAQKKDFEDGKMYVNIHTASNQAGEIRGNLKKSE